VSERLILRLGADHRSAWWFVLDSQGNRVGTPARGDLETAAAQAERRKLVLLAPGEAISLHRVTLPTRNTQKALQALPYALEDKLADDIDELHFAIAERRGDTILAAVVRRDLMDGWLNTLRAAGLQPVAVIPEFLGLPEPAEDAWTLLETAEYCLVRESGPRGFSVRRNLLPLLLNRSQPARARLFVADDATGQAGAELRQRGVETEDAGDELHAWTLGLADGMPLNLLQGPYQPRRSQKRNFRRWRWPAAAAAIWLVLGLGAWTAQYIQLHLAHQQLREQMVATVRDAFPGATVTADPRGQLESHLQGLRDQSGETGFLDVLGAVGGAMSQQTGLSLQAVSYRSGRLDLSVNADSVQSLDALKTALSQSGRWRVEIQAANHRDDHVEGRLEVLTEGA